MREPKSEIVVWGIGTPRTLRVHWCLHELGLDYQTEPIVARTPAMERGDFLQVSPGSKIPAFQHANISLTESGAITRYVMDTFGIKRWGAAEQATINRWIFFTLTELDATALYVIRRHAGLPHIYGDAPIAVSTAHAYAERALAVVADVLGDGRSYLAGEAFSEADIHLGTCLDWSVAIEIELPTTLRTYHERLRMRSAYQTASRANRTPLGS